MDWSARASWQNYRSKLGLFSKIKKNVSFDKKQRKKIIYIQETTIIEPSANLQTSLI